MLEIEGEGDTRNESQSVVGFDDLLARVIQRAVPEQKPLAAERQILAVIAREAVAHEGDAQPIVPAPRGRCPPESHLDRLLHVSVCKRFLPRTAIGAATGLAYRIDGGCTATTASRSSTTTGPGEASTRPRFL